MPGSARLNVSRVNLGQGLLEAEFHCMEIEPLPDDGVGSAVNSSQVGRATMAISTSRYASAVKRAAWMRFEPGRDALAIVIAEPTQDRPRDAGSIHRATSLVQLLTKIRIHPADHILSYGQAQPFRCR